MSLYVGMQMRIGDTFKMVSTCPMVFAILTKLDFTSNGRFRILFFTSTDLTNKEGESARALNDVCDETTMLYPKDTIELTVLHPFKKRTFEWSDIPFCVKERAEMRFHGPAEDDVYSMFGVLEDRGAVVAVRPDGYVGAIARLANGEKIQKYLDGCIVRVSGK